MSESFTPGPWHAWRNNAYWQIDAEEFGQVGDACASIADGRGSEALGRANATLMAAAPELYEALDGLVRAYRATLDAGFQRITALGGDCDPVAKMWAGDSAVQTAVAALLKASPEKNK